MLEDLLSNPSGIGDVLAGDKPFLVKVDTSELLADIKWSIPLIILAMYIVFVLSGLTVYLITKKLS